MAAVSAPEIALPRVTVAVLAYNRREPLATTLRVLENELDYPRERLEIIVVDNASTDGTADMVRHEHPGVKLIVSPDNRGIAGWNRAFAAGTGEWFLVLDDDCFVDGDGLRRAVAAGSEQEAGLVSLAVASSVPGERFSDAYRTGMLCFWGCAVLVRADAVRELGGFDERLFIWAHELDFTMRLLDAGYRHLHLPEVEAVHMKPVNGATVTSHRRNMRNWGYLAAKLLQPGDAVGVLGALIVRAALESGLDVGHLGGSLAAVKGFREGLRTRRPVRPAVSRLYRRNFLDFGSFFRPALRLRHWYGLRRGRRAPTFQQQYWDARPKLYPRAAAAIRIP